MTRNLARITIILGGVVGAAVAVGGLAAGCGGDDSGVVHEEGGHDVTTGDAPMGDALMGDGGEGGPGEVDGGDAASDANDFADIGDVQIDVPALTAFPHAVDEAYCTRLQQCCLVDPSQWNQDGADGGCAPSFDQAGGVFGVASFGGLAGGKVAYNQAAAYNCLHDFLSINCGTVASSSLVKVQNDCFAAMVGTLDVGAGPCNSSLECKPGGYCRVVGDASTGTCAALQTQGQPCVDTTSSTDCTYLGNGNPALYCAPGVDGGPATCQPALPLNGTCTQNPQCVTDSCNGTSCVDMYVFSDPGLAMGTCAGFTLPGGDAGAGGD
jgi:hypothetical protein